jgi:glycosyltransferase involved in cell wall biosynthesis
MMAYRCALHRARAVVAVSQATRHEIEGVFRIPPEKIRVIHAALDDRFQEEGDLTQGYAAGSRESFELPDRFLLYVGATLPHKNLANMIEGFAKALGQP